MPKRPVRRCWTGYTNAIKTGVRKSRDMDKPIIECIPNFSEGRDPVVIARIAEVISGTEGVRLLEVEPGPGVNRTVMTFVGDPEAVILAAFHAIREAGVLINMTQQGGAHPRLGATDVCPLVPLQGISLEETSVFATRLASRVGTELGIPVYLYEASATLPGRKNLAEIRRGEYEGLRTKLRNPLWKPDFGAPVFNPRSGATVIGARNFLVAYNVNLSCTSVEIAREIAFDIREKGRPRMANGRPALDLQGRALFDPGSLKYVKGIGWFIEEYGIAQVSMNLTNLHITPVHTAFEACRSAARKKGVRVTGSELIGLIPLKSLLDAGRFYLERQAAGSGGTADDQALIAAAITSLGLDELRLFDPRKKVIEYLLEAGE